MLVHRRGIRQALNKWVSFCVAIIVIHTNSLSTWSCSFEKRWSYNCLWYYGRGTSMYTTAYLARPWFLKLGAVVHLILEIIRCWPSTSAVQGLTLEASSGSLVACGRVVVYYFVLVSDSRLLFAIVDKRSYFVSCWVIRCCILDWFEFVMWIIFFTLIRTLRTFSSPWSLKVKIINILSLRLERQAVRCSLLTVEASIPSCILLVINANNIYQLWYDNTLSSVSCSHVDNL
jgi:hypothetical protein